ncbi:MAG TPA: hypothetical protein PLL32_04270 [Anaeromyxobacteraceae bacterium]|nr:hypothetical protein [Anaeromyxobacteraceae bacterium]
MRRDRGMASWVTILMLLGLAAAAYLGVVFVPPAVLHYEVKQVVRDYGNQAIKNRNDAELVEKMLQKIRTLQQVDAVDEAGRRVKIPVVDLRREDVTWERSAEPPTLHVAFEYPRTLEFPWLDRTIERVYTVDLTMDQTRADWGPVR